MIFILQVILGIFVLGILVLIHELGHFMVAKACGIRVLSFSIGFGKPLFTKTYGNTEYRISAIPFGGYVHMAGEHPEDNHVGQEDEFYAKPIWQRASVAIAGPVANIVSSIFFLWVLYMVGIQSQISIKDPIIGTVEKDSPAFIAGMRPKDKIITINNTSIQSWDQIRNGFSLQEKSYEVYFSQDGITRNVTLTMPELKSGEFPRFPAAGLEPIFPPRIGAVTPGSAAEKSGFLSNDLILAIDNVTITTWTQIPEIITRFNALYGPLQIVIQRNDSTIIISAEPTFHQEYKRFLLGIAPATAIVHYSPLDAIPKALEKSWEYTTLIFTMLSKLVNQSVSPKQLAGPIGIIQMSGAAALGSLVFLLNFMALIGINLGILNLFPLIITDGGVLFFLIIESIRKKPLPLKAQLLLNRLAIAFFITLFVFVTFNDIMRIPLLFKFMGR